MRKPALARSSRQDGTLSWSLSSIAVAPTRTRPLDAVVHHFDFGVSVGERRLRLCPVLVKLSVNLLAELSVAYAQGSQAGLGIGVQVGLCALLNWPGLLSKALINHVVRALAAQDDLTLRGPIDHALPLSGGCELQHVEDLVLSLDCPPIGCSLLNKEGVEVSLDALVPELLCSNHQSLLIWGLCLVVYIFLLPLRYHGVAHGKQLQVLLDAGHIRAHGPSIVRDGLVIKAKALHWLRFSPLALLSHDLVQCNPLSQRVAFSISFTPVP